MCTYTVLDLFCGAGGFSRGFELAGFRIAMGIDVDHYCVISYSLNFPDAIVLRRDVRCVTGRLVLEYLGDPPDVVIGGSPCEAFTDVNPNRLANPLDRLYVDELGQLTLHFIRIVGELKPRVFVLENVVGLAREPLRSAIEHEFRRVGYDMVYFNVLCAEDYGTPSVRRRVFISNIPIRPAKTKDRVCVWDAIGDLMGLEFKVPNHEPIAISERKLRRLSKLKWGEAMYRFRGAESTYCNFIRLHPYKLAPTVMGSSRFVHPFENRLLTVREQARLQGFPDSHVFYGPKESQFNQVGEAVPVPLALAMAKAVKRYLDGDQSMC